MCCSNSLNPDGSDPAFVGAGDGGVWRSMVGFCCFSLPQLGRAKSQGNKSTIPSFGVRRLKAEMGTCSSNIFSTSTLGAGVRLYPSARFKRAFKWERRLSVLSGEDWRDQLLQQRFVWMGELVFLVVDCAPSGVRRRLGLRRAKRVQNVMDGIDPFQQIGP